MIYTVVWTDDALNALADLYNRASDRRAVTQASDSIDRDLRIDAHNKGRPMGNSRLLYRAPLTVTFTVDPGDCMVQVIEVQRV